MLVKLLRWGAFGILASVTPFALSMLINTVVGYNLKELQYISDFLLVTFAIATAALSYGIDKDKHIPEAVRYICGIVSVLSMLYCLVLYFVFFNLSRDIPLYTNVTISIETSRIEIVLKITNIVFWVNAATGGVIEVWSHLKEKSNQKHSKNN